MHSPDLKETYYGPLAKFQPIYLELNHIISSLLLSESYARKKLCLT